MNSGKTSLMRQYQEIKDQHPESILFFQVGDFYETFYEDARKISQILSITLTSRDKKNPVPLAGVPIHASDAYISRLLKAGESVVICDQVEKASDAKGIVKREVTDIITPGTTLLQATLEDRENNYILSAVEKSGELGFALLDISTGEFHVSQDNIHASENMLAAYRIREAIIPVDAENIRTALTLSSPACTFNIVPSSDFNEKECVETLKNHFGINDLSCFGIDDKPLAIISSGVLLRYIKTLRHNELKHITNLKLLVSDDTLFLDVETVRNLELLEPLRGSSPETTLIYHIDRTKTSVGARELRKWLMQPSRVLSLIEERLDGISTFSSDHIRLRNLRAKMTGFPDIERILSRITTNKAGPRELLRLRDALNMIPGITSLCGELSSKMIRENTNAVETNIESKNLIENSIEPGCPAGFRDGGVIKKGFNSDLDILIDSSEDGRKWIASLQKSEREKTGIPSLRVGYNKVFGYYVEVSRIHVEKVPEEYTCKQSLVSSQRYITKELKEKENDILTADSRRIKLEKEIFSEICLKIAKESSALQKIAKGIATLDCLSSLADLAIDREYCRPDMNKSTDLVVSEGRHPVVEVISNKSFIPNDIVLRPNEKQFLLITGPNMGGKSTYIRQTALISIMAQMGSFVPASRAEIGLMDRIFTRVGSSDNLAKGQSTFLVEMGETAKILNNCTSKSLVLLDEIGRGTSTLDGLSIAWAVTEYLLEEEGKKPKALFATHFHELTQLAEKYHRIRNMRVDVREWENSIVFLYRIIEGKSDRSYGIHVAQMAGIPSKVIEKAWIIFKSLEKTKNGQDNTIKESPLQPSLFKETLPVIKKLQEIDTDILTPLQALQILSELRKMSNNSL